MSVELDSSRDESHTIMSSLMVLLVILGLTTVLCSVLLVIAKRQEAMLDELLKRSGSMQETSVLINPETRSQGGSILPGSGR
jgi:cytoskeletal protein RodZ